MKLWFIGSRVFGKLFAIDGIPPFSYIAFVLTFRMFFRCVFIFIFILCNSMENAFVSNYVKIQIFIYCMKPGDI